MITIYKSDEINNYKEIIQNEDIWSFPVQEIDYLLNEHKNENFIYFDNRLYEYEKTKMSKNDLINAFNRIGNSGCNDLYSFSCLKLSGFNENDAYNLINLLNELWLKDETNTPISTLSDLLYENIENIDTETMTTREILKQLF